MNGAAPNRHKVYLQGYDQGFTDGMCDEEVPYIPTTVTDLWIDGYQDGRKAGRAARFDTGAVYGL
jgi:ribosome modulation factor